MLVKALLAAGREVKYYPVDASQTLLETACAAAEDEDCDTLGIKADISSPMHLLLAADVSEAPRLFLMVGNTLGGFDPLDQIRHLANCVHKGDILILDATLRGGDAVKPSDEQRRFAFAPLVVTGLTADDGELEYAEKPDDRLDGLFMLTRRFHAGRDLRMLAVGREVPVARGGAHHAQLPLSFLERGAALAADGTRRGFGSWEKCRARTDVSLPPFVSNPDRVPDRYATMISRESLLREFGKWDVRDGSPGPMGVTWVEPLKSWNFALYSRRATGVTLLLYAESDPVVPVREIRFNPRRNKSGRIWHCWLAADQAPGATLYAYRVDGRYDPKAGFRFDATKILLDPFARSVIFSGKLQPRCRCDAGFERWARPAGRPADTRGGRIRLGRELPSAS